MIKLGVNTVLFGGFDLKTALTHIKAAGYDGAELSAIKGMCEHLNLDGWSDQVKDIKAMAGDIGLELLSIEEAALDPERLKKAYEACAALGIPIVNIGSGGKMNVEEDFVKQTDLIAQQSEVAASYKITLCVKAHVGAAVFNSPTTLRAMEKIKSPYFGIDMDPSHIYRAGEKPEQALPNVISRVKHIHIRDCKGLGPAPGTPEMQACGRGDIDLVGYFKAMVTGKYNGPVCLEVIGAGKYELARCAIIAAESYGYMNAVLKSLGAR